MQEREEKISRKTPRRLYKKGKKGCKTFDRVKKKRTDSENHLQDQTQRKRASMIQEKREDHQDKRLERKERILTHRH